MSERRREREKEKRKGRKNRCNVGEETCNVCTARNSASIRIIARDRLIGPEMRVSVVIGSVSVRVRMPRVYYVHGSTCVRISVVCNPIAEVPVPRDSETEEEEDCGGERR